MQIKINHPASIHFVSKKFVGRRKPQGWEVSIHLQKTVISGESIEAQCYTVHLYR